MPIDGQYILTGKRSESFGRAVLRLIVHIIAASFLLLSLFVVEWAIDFALDWLNAIHPFSAGAGRLRQVLGTAFTCIDAAVALLVVFVGGFRFLRENVR